MGKLRITLVKSTIGCTDVQKGTVAALGLKKIGHTAEHEDNSSIRGMIFRVKHLLKVEEI
ncbi:MAG: 50S ribosomal protein L30 [Bacillota bacterium]|nr:50S ribosomal protein L30 [Bacillota bacterium]